MTIQLFGIAKEMIGDKKLTLTDDTNISSVGELKEQLSKQFPKLLSLQSWAIAVDSEYANDNTTVDKRSEIALLPPVSGG
ncbi:MAG: MoaD/ThiS family protein [Bacteroidota bacterium]|nr:MoaD/ThiS family protein [Bacteroidota bacterium]